MPTGRLIQKIQRQDANEVRNPPTSGPRIGPSSAGMLISASARTSCSFSTERTRISRATGTIMAPPIPWTMRAPMSH